MGGAALGTRLSLGNFRPILFADSPLIWALEKQNSQVRRLDGLINGSIETIHLIDNKMKFDIYCFDYLYIVGKHTRTTFCRFVVTENDYNGLNALK